jgi:DNA-binding MarR family transcriptional regulator
MLEKLELTYPQYLVMMVLWEEKTVSVKYLGERLFLDSGTLTPLLKRMETSGLVLRERSAEDERLVNITITDKGTALESLAESVPSQIKCKIQMDDEEIASLRNYIKKILSACAKNK